MSKALTYAEQNLGVHSCYEAAESARNQLDSILGDLDKAQDDRRLLTEDIADREIALLVEEQGKHATMSATALKEHIKVVYRRDEELRDLRTRLTSLNSLIGGLEYDAEMQKHKIRIECARMEELGGYLNYLAAVKQAETTAKLTKPTKQENQ